MSDTVRLSLMESYVLPVLTYALGAVSLTSSMLREFSVFLEQYLSTHFWYEQVGISYSNSVFLW